MSHRWRSVAALLGILLASAIIVAVPALHWRAKVIGLKIKGDLPDIPAAQLLSWMLPHSPVWLGGLATRPNVGPRAAR